MAWIAIDKGHTIDIYADSPPRFVCSVPAHLPEVARLIKAAPDMLAALNRQIANIEHWLETGEPAGPEESRSIYEQMVAAAKKARE